MLLALDQRLRFTLPSRLTWFLRATLALHVLAVFTVWWWPVGVLAALVLNHALIVAATLWPRSTWLGPNRCRLPAAAASRGELAITIDDGPDPEVTPRVLELLESLGLTASFFCIADRVAAYPELARDIVARGHDIQNHTASHRHTFSFLGPRAYLAEVERAQQIIERVTGHRPTCFRAPAGFRNPFLAPVLAAAGLELVSWTRRGFDTREADAERVLGRLTRGLRGGDILLLHDGHAARDGSGQPVICALLPALAARCRQAGLKTVRLSDALV
ncbi:polysaccharide deacetylase family protein [Ideonella sp. DXS29W]|uniref:Polysaccharide deacetylase family protein n=1 Tax=Ideonella lacteola TaxID=2984193 RepID=A0ABU9BNK6_9BURK